MDLAKRSIGVQSKRGARPTLTGAAAIVTATFFAATGAEAAEPVAFPSLDEAIRRAREAPSLVVAAAGARRAAAALGVGARLSSVGNPYLEVFADREAPARSGDLAIQGNLWLPVEVSGQRGRRIAANERLTDWRGAQLDAVLWDSVALVVRRYGAAVVGAERTRFLEAIVASSAQQTALYEARLSQSDTTARDAKLAAVDLSRNRMALAEARADLARALAELARSTGVVAVSSPVGDERPASALWALAAREPDQLIDDGPNARALAREAEYFSSLGARERAESRGPLSLILSGGRAPNGAARVGGGMAWTFPAVRRNQGEQARAAAERTRSLDVASASRRERLAVLQGLVSERTEIVNALEELRLKGEPAAQGAVAAAIGTERAGKGELLHVLMAQRDLVAVRASGLALEEREWSLLAELVALTGRNP